MSIDGTRTLLEPGYGLMILPFQSHTFPDVAADEILWLILTFETEQLASPVDFRGKVFAVDGTALEQIATLPRLYQSQEDETSNQLLGLGKSALVIRLRPLVQKASVARITSDQRAPIAKGYRRPFARGAHVSINEIALALHISESRLRARFRAAYSTALGSYLSNYRLHRVIELMRDARLNLSEIAAVLGFSDSAAFARFFRNETGSTARDFWHRMLNLTAPPAAE